MEKYNHLNYVRNIKASEDVFDIENKKPIEAFRLACNLIEADAEDYERYIKVKINRTFAKGFLIGIIIVSTFALLYTMYKF
jgi:hypothetical protein